MNTRPLKNQFPIKRLLLWYDENKRDLPWRKTRDIYKIWLSEVMLQQTQVATVIPYYRRFLKHFPTIESLASANEQEVLKLWEGLGYYNRCHNFFRAAKQVVENFNGRIPDQPQEFKKLPGVGPYILAAVLSIALDIPLPVLDGNVIRVITRFYEIKEDISKGATKKKIQDILTDYIPEDNPGDFNQAMMELGALICTPRPSDCDHCPLNTGCGALLTGQTGTIPYKPPKKKIPVYNVSIAVIIDQGRFLIQKRPSKGHLAGMWEFPGGKIENGETPSQAVIRECREELNTVVRIIKKLKTVSHTYTHFKINLHVFLCGIKNSRPKGMKQQPIQWITVDQIEIYPFPGANHKFFPELKEYLKRDFHRIY
jgi:A/G-specific adenine glycosylase